MFGMTCRGAETAWPGPHGTLRQLSAELVRAGYGSRSYGCANHELELVRPDTWNIGVFGACVLEGVLFLFQLS